VYLCPRTCVRVCLCVCLMIFDYNKLLVKRSNIVVYSSLQSPLLAAPDRGCVYVGVCVYYIITHLVTCRDRIVAPVPACFLLDRRRIYPPRTTISFFRKEGSGSPGLRSIDGSNREGGGFRGTSYSSRVRSRHFHKYRSSARRPRKKIQWHEPRTVATTASLGLV